MCYIVVYDYCIHCISEKGAGRESVGGEDGVIVICVCMCACQRKGLGRSR